MLTCNDRLKSWSSKIRAALIPVLILLFFASPALAENGIPIPPQATSAVGSISPAIDRDKLEARIDDLFMGVDQTSPGVAVIVLQAGEVLAHREFGMASLEHAVPFTANHVVRLGYSEMREFIAIAAVLMERDGLLRLDDRVNQYFPRLPGWSEPVTIWHLINHASGFVDEWATLLLMHASMNNRFDTSQFLRLLCDQPVPEIEPGKGYMYSNSDYGLLRLILEEASGENLSAWIERRILKPLGMHSTRMHDNAAEVIPHRAHLYYEPDNDGRLEIYVGYKDSPGGNYYIATTASDLVSWAAAHADPDSEIAQATRRLMDGGTLLPGMEGHYAFGHTVTMQQGTNVVRHEGVLGSNYLTRLPDHGLDVITFGNRVLFGENRAIVDFILGVSPEGGLPTVSPEPVDVALEVLESYAGWYVLQGGSWESHEESRELTNVFLQDGTLIAGFDWGYVPLVPLGEHTFSGEEGHHYTFESGRGTEPMKLTIRFGGSWPDETLVRNETQWRPDADALERLAGTYTSGHLGYPWTFVVDELGRLVLFGPTLPEIVLEPWGPDEFLLPHEKHSGEAYYAWIRFHTDDQGQITHLTVWNPRLMHHRFEREPRS